MKKRVITPRREILAKDVNDLNDFIEDNFIVYSRDILGVSDGIAQGLTIDAFADLDITINAGVAFSNGKFYELLTNTTLTLPSTSGVYKIYATKSSTSDLPISGYVLLDTSTRQETYDAVNSRTYDSLTLGYTLGSVPSNAFLLGEATVSGSIITTYDDQRTLTSIGNLASNSIQAFSETARNYGTSENEITGFIFDQTDVYKPFVKVTIDNAFEGKAIVIDNGTNAGSQGIYNLVRGNIGSYTAFSGSNGIGSFSELSSNNIGFATNSATSGTTIGFRATNADVGFKSVNSTVGLKIENDSSSVSGIQIVGSNSGLDKGIEITDTYEGIVLENNNRFDLAITKNNMGGAVTENASIILNLTNNDINSATRFYFGIIQDLYGKNIAGNVVKFHPTALDSSMLGYGVEGGLSTDTATVGFNGAKLARGVYLEDNAVGVNILPKANQIGIQIDGTDLINNNIGIEINNVDKPISIINDTNQSSALIELEGLDATTNSSIGLTLNKLNKGIRIDNSNIGIELSSTNALGIKIDQNAKPIEITNTTTKATTAMLKMQGLDNTSNSSTAIKIDDMSTAIRVDDSNFGLLMYNNYKPIRIDNSTTNSTEGQIYLIGKGKADTGSLGMSINDEYKGILISNSEYGVEISQNVDQAINILGTSTGDSIGVSILERKKPLLITNNFTSTTNAMIELVSNTSSNGILINSVGDYGLKIQNTTRGIDLSSANIDFPFRVHYLEGSDPLPSSASDGDIVFRLIGGTTFDIYMYDSTLADWRKNNGQDT